MLCYERIESFVEVYGANRPIPKVFRVECASEKHACDCRVSLDSGSNGVRVA